jgi:hypothetical protein
MFRIIETTFHITYHLRIKVAFDRIIVYHIKKYHPPNNHGVDIPCCEISTDLSHFNKCKRSAYSFAGDKEQYDVFKLLYSNIHKKVLDNYHRPELYTFKCEERYNKLIIYKIPNGVLGWLEMFKNIKHPEIQHIHKQLIICFIGLSDLLIKDIIADVIKHICHLYSNDPIEVLAKSTL